LAALYRARADGRRNRLLHFSEGENCIFDTRERHFRTDAREKPESGKQLAQLGI